MYVGKIKRQLKISLSENIQSIIKKDGCPLSLHFLRYHDGVPDGLTCKGIYKLNLPSRRGDSDRILYHKEKMWIYNLGSLQPRGLNNECYFFLFYFVWTFLSLNIKAHGKECHGNVSGKEMATIWWGSRLQVIGLVFYSRRSGMGTCANTQPIRITCVQGWIKSLVQHC